MSSGFVSGGTTDQPIERDDEWRKAQEAIEATRKRKEEEGQLANGKSLYEVLQQNNAKKQEAFEESIRLKNQFRTLDEDEVDFLDSVLESTRAKEDAIKKETNEQLEAFRRQQETADQSLLLGDESTNSSNVQGPSPPSENTEWGAGIRKRKRLRENNLLKAVKARKPSTSIEATSEKISTGDGSSKTTLHATPSSKSQQVSEGAAKPSTSKPVVETKPPKTIPVQTPRESEPKPGGLLGLGAYDSDDD